MFRTIAFGAAVATLAASAAAQQPQQQPSRPSIAALLGAGFDLKTVVMSSGPCGNQPANRAQSCPRELYFFQSPQKNLIFRCELGRWNGVAMAECLPIG